jgi:XTP/dITP diphosphohydrolase
MRRFTGDRIVLATHNRGKREEMAALFGPRGVTVLAAPDLGLPEPEETEETFAGNAALKALAAARATGLPALADDSGLVVDALGGAPGVRTADWATLPDGRRDFIMAMHRLHESLERSGAPAPWRAHFVCVLALGWPDGHVERAEGRVSGQVVWPMRGTVGHGFDPVFEPEGHSRTFAELTPAEKNAISHRARAVAQLLDRCFT